MEKKKWLVVLLAVLMQFAFLPGSVRAVEVAAPAGEKPSFVVSGTVKTPASEVSGTGEMISQEKALTIFCEAFPDITRGKKLTAELQEGSMDNQIWHIRSGERNPSFSNGFEIDGQVDARSGEITGMNYNPDPAFYKNKKVNLTREQAYEAANKFLRNFQPDKAGMLRLQDAVVRTAFPDSNMNLYYNFTWQRVVNGVVIDWDSINIGVDAYTGMVAHYHCNWHKIEPANTGQLLPHQEIEQVLKDNIELVPYYTYERNQMGETSGKIIPVYRLNIDAVAIDARTGKFLDQQGQVKKDDELKLYDRELVPVVGGSAINEPSWTDKMVNPETGRKAAQDFFKSLGYEGEIRRSGGGSGSGPGYKDEYWSYSPQGESSSRLRVEVNAFTGQVASFREETTVETSGTAELSYNQALDIAREAIKRYDSDKVNSVILSRNMHYVDERPYYHFRFERILNGIPFSRDGISITLNGKSGQILNYSREWRPVQCDSLSPLIPAQEIKSKVWEKNPLNLSYLFTLDKNYRPTGDSIPVYRIPYVQINAVTGELVNPWEQIKTGAVKQAWSQHWAAPFLSLLQENSLIPDKDFKAEDIMSRRSILKVLVAATNPRVRFGDELNAEVKLSDINNNDPDWPIFKLAVNRGIIPGEGKFNPEGSMSREELAVWLINALGYQDIAQMSNRIETPVKDNVRISPDKLNYAGLAYGMGLMSPDQSGYWRPQENITWAQMAVIATRLVPRAPERP